ncbi:MAG: triose-phosphate isomerase [Hyphomicrobiales bacterium]|nr:triose-phosphate isomerase [Hyphomicrobiales bacterium]
MDKFWVGTSWKMHKTLAEAQAFSHEFAAFLPECDASIQPFVIPPFTSVRQVKQALSATRVKVGAQNMHWAHSGPWTGEISPLMLKDCGLDLVELGHSERREHFGETDEAVGLKVAAAVKHELTPLICVGETQAERDAGRAEDAVRKQVHAALAQLEGGERDAEILLAYEPVWAIGEGGVPATAEYAGFQHAVIKDAAARILPRIPPVLYGCSVNPGNVAELARHPDIDGLFVGRSALQAAGYIDIIRRAAAAL